MTTPIKLDLSIYQGATFSKVLRYETSKKLYINITSISKSAPIVITAPNHGIPEGWRFKISGVKGMIEANSLDWSPAANVTSNTLVINNINATEFSTYTSGGLIEYYEPVNLQGATGRLQIRNTINNPTVLYSMTTENGGIVINNTDKTIEFLISSGTTQTFNFSKAVYSFELILNTGDVIPLLNGNVILEREVTR